MLLIFSNFVNQSYFISTSSSIMVVLVLINSLAPGIYMAVILTHWGRNKMAATLAEDTFKRKFVNENILISMKIWLKFVSKGPINNMPALV